MMPLQFSSPAGLSVAATEFAPRVVRKAFMVSLHLAPPIE
jgi:hypothetical protein